MRSSRLRALLASLAVALLLASSVEAQLGQRRGVQRRGYNQRARIATDQDFVGSFNFFRIVFRNAVDGDGGGWSVDYPRADENLSIRLSELTKTPISLDEGGAPNHLLVRLTDPQLLDCPFVMMTEPGGAFLDEKEAEGLRTYLLKGGFLWADDFWGNYAWDHWVAQLRKALPSNEYPIFDLPLDHPLFTSQFQVDKVPQIPSIGFFFEGGTSERGAESAVAHLRGIQTKNGRLMVVMTHNTDVGDSWERESDDPTYFLNFGPRGYALGINILLYTLTH